jgi:cytochrome o ubiquinol oxidase subunit 3
VSGSYGLPASGASTADPHARAFHLAVEEDHHPENGTLLGFWIYLMSDCLIFAALFATYGVLGTSYAGGPSQAEIFKLPTVALNTLMLLLSSITYGFAMLAMAKGNKGATLIWLGITGLFGAAFVALELQEFAELIRDGAAPERSAFLSSFFALVGTHGLHVSVGIIWLITLMVQVGMKGLTQTHRRRLMCLSLFWHFLDVIWIGVFSFVYLIGVLR